MKNTIVSGLGIGVVLHWLSLFLSYRELPDEGIYKPIATGGFPFKAFEYPFPPMGSDWPPADMWPMFFLNLVIWMAVSVLVVFVLGKKLKNQKLYKAISILATLLSVFGIFYIMLKFD